MYQSECEFEHKLLCNIKVMNVWICGFSCLHDGYRENFTIYSKYGFKGHGFLCEYISRLLNWMLNVGMRGCMILFVKKCDSIKVI